MKTTLAWHGKMAFEATNRGLTSAFDTDAAPTPKEALLNAMCACSAMDVVSITEKMRLTLKDVRLEAEATKTKTIPSYFSAVHIHYFIEGDVPAEKIIQAVALSMTKYCGVSYMVSKVCDITYDVTLNGNLIHKDQANFSLEVI
jgi:putative redox protein